MAKSVADIVKERIIERHQDDKRQLEVVFSETQRLLVEAPAGYGKTNTMVSKIAYMIATGQIPNPKKLLALTFSVNAAYKIKRDVIAEVPLLLNDTGLDVQTREKIFVSNYHGFCRSVLKRCGGVFHPSLASMNLLEPFDDTSPERSQKLIKGLSLADATTAANFAQAVKDKKVKDIYNNLNEYCDVAIRHYLPNNCLSFNGILALTIKLFNDFEKVAHFYHSYYTALVVDEFQDTNWLSFWLLKCLISEKTKVVLLGDSLQRIYGFIGAVPDVLEKSQQRFGLEKIQLTQNYRFASNPEMLALDNNIRRIAENPSSPSIDIKSDVNLIQVGNQIEEANEVFTIAVDLVSRNPAPRVAILAKQRHININVIMGKFNDEGIPFFYGLFGDDDPLNVRFHQTCLTELIDLVRIKSNVGRRMGLEHIARLNNIYKDSQDPVVESLGVLLKVFWQKIYTDFAFLTSDEKLVLLKDTFAHNGLKQFIEYVGSNIVISTVHAAKGLEWDYVILPDMEQDSFPNWYGLCNSCQCRSDCRLVVDSRNESRFLEELSVFYVAVTRAKKKVFFTSSLTAPDNFGNERPKNTSCFLGLSGIRVQTSGSAVKSLK